MEALEGFLDELYGDFWVTMLKGLHTLRLRNKNIYIYIYIFFFFFCRSSRSKP